MGEKGAKLSNQVTEVCEEVLKILSPLGDVNAKKMFGGYGIFESGAMFALIDSNGKLFFKVDNTNRANYEELKASAHGKMPYYQVPSEIIEDVGKIQDWAKTSIRIVHLGKRN